MSGEDHTARPVFSVIFETGRPSPYRLVGSDACEVGEAVAFLDVTALRGLSPATLRTYAFALRSIYWWLASRSLRLQDLTLVHVSDLILYLKEEAAAVGRPSPAPRTTNLKLTVLRALYTFHEQRGLPRAPRAGSEPGSIIGQGFCSRFGIPHRSRPRRSHLRVKVPQELVVPLTREAVRRFFQSLGTWRDTAMVSLMLFSGLRRHEVLGLRLEDLRLDQEQIRVRGKGRKERLLPLAAETRTALSQYLRRERPDTTEEQLVFLVLKGRRRGRPLTPEGLRNLFRYHRRRFDVPEANPHRFRHTFAVDMTRAGLSLPALQRLMGHANIEMTMRYINLQVDDLREEFHRAILRRQEEHDAPSR